MVYAWKAHLGAGAIAPAPKLRRRSLRIVYAHLRMVYAMFTHCLRMITHERKNIVYACLRMFTHVYALITQCLRMVYARLPMSVNIRTRFHRVVYACLRMFTHVYAYQVYAVVLRKSSSYSSPEAPTCPETSPWPMRSYAIAWFRRLHLEQSQPDHLDSTFRRGRRNPLDS
jgi:hypothetical protein